MKTVDVVIAFATYDGEPSPHPHEVLVFEDRRDTLGYLETEQRATTTNNAFWDKTLVAGCGLRFWLRTARIKESSLR